jgi:hypothetical protein
VSSADVFDVGDALFTINRPPSASATAASIVEAGRPVTLDGTAASDPDGDALMYHWTEGGTPMAATVVATVEPATLGPHVYSLTVTDPYGASDTTTVGVLVEDTTRPAVTLFEPFAGKELVIGQPVRLRWRVVEAGLLTDFKVTVSFDHGATYGPVPGCAALPATRRSCLWTPLQTGTLLIRVVARDSMAQGGAGGASFHVRAGEP